MTMQDDRVNRALSPLLNYWNRTPSREMLRNMYEPIINFGADMAPVIGTAKNWQEMSPLERALSVGFDAADVFGLGAAGRGAKMLGRIPGVRGLANKAVNPFVDFWRRGRQSPVSIQDLPEIDPRAPTLNIRYGPPRPDRSGLYPAVTTEPPWQKNPEDVLPFVRIPIGPERTPFTRSKNWGLGGYVPKWNKGLPDAKPYPHEEAGISSYTAIPRPKTIQYTPKNPGREGLGKADWSWEDVAEGFTDAEGNP